MHLGFDLQRAERLAYRICCAEYCTGVNSVEKSMTFEAHCTTWLSATVIDVTERINARNFFIKGV